MARRPLTPEQKERRNAAARERRARKRFEALASALIDQSIEETREREFEAFAQDLIDQSIKETRERERKQKRSEAARRGWEKRRAKSPRDQFEAERRKRNAENLRKVKRDFDIDKRVPYGKYKIHRYADEYRFSVAELSIAQIIALVNILKQGGVTSIRYLRDTPILTDKEINDNQTQPQWRGYIGTRTLSGRVSSRYYNLQQVSNAQIMDGIPGIVPGINQMLDPSQDYLQYIVIKQRDIKGLPDRLKALLRKKPELSREELITTENSSYLWRDGTEITGEGANDNDEEDDE